MCETATNRVPGWNGWLDLPAPKISGAAGAWVDLSHRLTEELSRIPSFPQPRIRQITRIPEHRANVTEVHMVVHHAPISTRPAISSSTGRPWSRCRSPGCTALA